MTIYKYGAVLLAGLSAEKSAVNVPRFVHTKTQ